MHESKKRETTILYIQHKAKNDQNGTKLPILALWNPLWVWICNFDKKHDKNNEDLCSFVGKQDFVDFGGHPNTISKEIQ